MSSVLTVLVVLGVIGVPVGAAVLWLMLSKRVQARKESAVIRMQQLYEPEQRPQRPQRPQRSDETQPRLQVPALSMIGPPKQWSDDYRTRRAS